MIIGVGTGHSGTKNLAKLLGLSHEPKPLLPFKKDFRLLNQHLKGQGAVALYFTHYIPNILHLYPDAKIVCLKRDKDKTVKGFLKGANNFNHFNDVVTHSFDVCFPDFGTSMEEGLGLWWDWVYKFVESYEILFPDNVKVFDISVLDTKEGQDRIFDFVDRSLEERRYVDEW